MIGGVAADLPSRVAVLGGKGFVGAALLRRLRAEGREVTSFSRSGAGGEVDGVDWIVSERLNRDTVRLLLRNAGVVFNCAGAIRRENGFYAANVELVRSVAQACAGSGVRLVHLGSLGVFAGHRRGRITEESEMFPVGAYETSKTEADRILCREAERTGLAVSILRPAAIVDSRMPSTWLRSLTRSLSGKRPFLVAGGAGILSLSALPSVVEALKVCGSAAGQGARVFHLAQSISFEGLLHISRSRGREPAHAVSIPAWFAKCVARIPGSPLTPDRLDTLTRAVEFPSEKIASELGYEEKHPIEPFLEGLVAAWSKQQ